MQESTSFPVLELPPELTAIVISFLDGVHLIRFGMASKECLKFTQSDKLWQRRVKCELRLENKMHTDWKTLYLQKKKEIWLEKRKYLTKRELIAENVKQLDGILPTLWGRAKAKLGILKFANSSEFFRILLLGLDAAGKTTMIYKLKLGEIQTYIPTIGFNIETVSIKSRVTLTVWDVGGPDKIRPLWRHYYEQSLAMIWMVDSNDKDRIGEAREELWKCITDDTFPSPYLLVFANKQDLPNALSVAQVSEKLDLGRLPHGIEWYVQPCCAISGDGLWEGFNWLNTVLKK